MIEVPCDAEDGCITLSWEHNKRAQDAYKPNLKHMASHDTPDMFCASVESEFATCFMHPVGTNKLWKIDVCVWTPDHASSTWVTRKGRAQSPCFECIVTAAAHVSLPLCCCSTSRGVVALVESASCDLFEREGSKI